MFDDDRRYAVVRNGDDQYSIWPADRQPSAGWELAGPDGSLTECLEHIRLTWTDMRPRGLREAHRQHETGASG